LKPGYLLSFGIKLSLIFVVSSAVRLWSTPS
jgi:hypothetical protein